MSRKKVGYFEGTDSAVLTSLICDGCDTIPISNGLDNFGMHVRVFNEENKVDLLMGYLHKIYAPVGAETTAEDMFQICAAYQIPFLVIVPEEQHDCARKKLDDCPDCVTFVDPAQIRDKARELLTGSA